MIQTATLSPVNTLSQGPALLQPSAQGFVTAGDFAGSFAKASDDAAANPRSAPGPVPNPAVDMAAPFASPIDGAIAEAPSSATNRQEWAATGNDLPIPVLATAVLVAATAAWPPTGAAPLATESVPSPTAPVDQATAAAIAAGPALSLATRSGARASTTTGRQTPATLSRPAAAVRHDDQAEDTDQDGDAGDGSVPTTDAATLVAPAPALRAQDVAVSTQLAAATTNARPPRTDAENPGAAVLDSAEPVSQAPPRSARRGKPVLSETARRPIPMRDKAIGSNIPRVDDSVPESIETVLAGPTTSPRSSAMPGLLPGMAAEMPEVELRAVTPMPTGRVAERVVETELPLAAGPTPSPELSALGARVLPTPDASGVPTPPASPETVANVRAIASGDAVPMAPPAVPSSRRRAFTDGSGTMPTSAAAIPGSSSMDRSNLPLLSLTRPNSMRPDPEQPDLALPAVDDVQAMPVPIVTGQLAPVALIAPDAPTGDGVSTRSDRTVTMIPVPSAPTLAITGEPARAFASPAPSAAPIGGLTREPQDLRVVPANVPFVAPAVPAPTRRAPDGSIAPETGIPRWTAGQATASDMNVPPLSRVSTVPSIPSTPPQASPLPGSPSVPTAAANVQDSQSPALTANTPPGTSTPRWTATDATTPVTLAVARPELVQPQPGTVASAAQVFGAAIQAAQIATKPRDDRDKTGFVDATSLSVAIAPAQPTAAGVTGAAQQAPLDMRQDRWPHAMIERIEMIRDAADATDTRIRLIPDALGAIDVSVKTAGDTVHVHFNAEQAATRTLLADAQPRLAELAEARGLKLGQGATGDSNGGGSQQRAPAPQQTANRTARAPSPVAQATEDTRIA